MGFIALVIVACYVGIGLACSLVPGWVAVVIISAIVLWYRYELMLEKENKNNSLPLAGPAFWVAVGGLVINFLHYIAVHYPLFNSVATN